VRGSLKYKKGNVVLSIIIIAIVVFTLTLSTMLLQEPLQDIKNEFVDDPENSEEAKAIFTAQQDNYQSAWDGFIIFIFAFLWIFGIVSAFFIDSHPFFFVLAILMLIAAFYVVMLLANEYTIITTEDENLSSFAQNDYPLSTWIIEHLFEVMAVMGFTFLVALYGKFRMG